MNTLHSALVANLLFAGGVIVQAKDGHGAKAGPSKSVRSSTYKSPARTYYSYTPPKVMNTPKSAYAPIKNSTGDSGKLVDSARQTVAGTKMSKNWNTKVDSGVAKAKTWASSARIRK